MTPDPNLASAYVRTFSTDDGKRVLEDLRRKFGIHRLCFSADERGRFDYIKAAVTDGQRSVMSEIEAAFRAANSTL